MNIGQGVKLRTVDDFDGKVGMITKVLSAGEFYRYEVLVFGYGDKTPYLFRESEVEAYNLQGGGTL